MPKVMPTAKKIQTVQSLKSRSANSQGLILLNFQGLTTTDLNLLRQRLASTFSTVTVVKNTLFKIALASTSYPLTKAPDQIFEYPTAAVFLPSLDPQTLKILFEFIKEKGLPAVKAGFWGKDFLTAAALQQIALLPNKEVLVARLINQLQAPLVNLLGLLQTSQLQCILALVEIARLKDSKASVSKLSA